ncbi:MAG: 16S rRNA (cytosine1402-N4)-methyltransferase [Polaribacter sp.]|jgi:16S rRNA (cytosine1402-N4)-methyltransferase
MEYHDPVLLKESLEGLITRGDGIYIDATFGGGGHSKKIIEKLSAEGHLYGFDQDADVLPNITEDERFTFLHYNFRYLQRILRLHGIEKVDGILADLGVSSHQFDDASRGFSYRFEAELDMRMDQQQAITAAEILNTYEVDTLQNIFSQYGEVRNAKTLAQAIVRERGNRPITTTGDFMMVIDGVIRGNRIRYLSQVFQALRIEVNDEMGALKDFLAGSLEVLKPGGRLVIISYHSLEDRMAKQFLKSGNFEGTVEKDFFGNINRPFKLISKKAISPTEEEIKRNPRARSAKMRIGEKK